MTEVNAGSMVSLNSFRVSNSKAEEKAPEKKNSNAGVYLDFGTRIYVPVLTGIPSDIKTIPYDPGNSAYSYELNDGPISTFADYTYIFGLSVMPTDNVRIFANAGDFHRESLYYSMGAEYQTANSTMIGYKYEHNSVGFRDGITYREKDDAPGEAYALLHVQPISHEINLSKPLGEDFRVGAGVQYINMNFIQAYDTYDKHEILDTVDTAEGYGLRLFGEWRPNSAGPRASLSYTYGNVTPSKYDGDVSYQNIEFGLQFPIQLSGF